LSIVACLFRPCVPSETSPSVSTFFATHGIMLTVTIWSGETPSFWAKNVLIRVPIIACGDLHVLRCGSSCGYVFSTKLTQPGQQDVNIGRTPPFLTRDTNSVASCSCYYEHLWSHLHDCDIGREVGVKDIVKTELPQGSNKFSCGYCSFPL
jgi:hypothetical protein